MRTLLDHRVDAAGRILFAGCGGGFDVFSAVPMALHAHALGKVVSFANLSFTDLAAAGGGRVGPTGRLVTPESPPLPYFPERTLARWLAGRGVDAPVYAFESTGVVPLRVSYEAVVERERPDLVVLVDGGTDALLKGDEEGLGTVVEDASSVVAVSGVAGPSKVLACLGFGVDHYHGISHYRFLENVSEAIRLGGFLGCATVMAGTPEGDAFLDLVDVANAEHPGRESIVANSVASAIRGMFGDRHATERTRRSTLFVNPLMAQYWAFDLGVVASMMGFAAQVERSVTVEHVLRAVDFHRLTRLRRKSQALPL